MPKTDAQYKTAERERKTSQGLKRKELWTLDELWPQIKRYADKLLRRGKDG